MTNKERLPEPEKDNVEAKQKTPLERFRRLAQQVISVPKEKIDEAQRNFKADKRSGKLIHGSEDD